MKGAFEISLAITVMLTLIVALLVTLPAQYRTPVSGGNLVCINPLLIPDTSVSFALSQFMHHQEAAYSDEGGYCSRVSISIPETTTIVDDFYTTRKNLDPLFKWSDPLEWLRTTFYFLKANLIFGPHKYSLYSNTDGELQMIADMKNCIDESKADPNKEYLLICTHTDVSMKNLKDGIAVGPVKCTPLLRYEGESPPGIKSSSTVHYSIDFSPINAEKFPFRSDLTEKIYIHGEPSKTFSDWVAHYWLVYKLTQLPAQPGGHNFEIAPRLHTVECFPK